MPLSPSRRIAGCLWLGLGLAACASTAPTRSDIAALPADADLDARTLPRGAAQARPATVNVQTDPAGTTLFTVSPRLRSGSASNPPLIEASLGASRPRGGPAVYQALISISVPRTWRDFSQVAARDMPPLGVRRVGRDTDCQTSAGTCLYRETLVLDLPEAPLRALADSGRGLRLRIDGNAAFVETGLPAGHLRALFEAMAPAAPGGAAGAAPSRRP
ncbi:MAG TPA: hypothetical protein VGM87_16670 [Roseomonas sp.]|jgi:hypothetical protein